MVGPSALRGESKEGIVSIVAMRSRGADESSRILVNVRLDSQSLEQLSWAVTVASRPGDSVVALHLLHDSDSEVRSIEKQYERARAGVYSLLEQCRELCHFRQVTADVRILPVIDSGQNRLKILLEQASLLAATTLVLSSSDVAPHSKLTGFTVCGAAAPRSCLVFVAEDSSDKPSSQESEQHDESAQRQLLAEANKSGDCHFMEEQVPQPFHFKEVPSDYSPRGVLEGPSTANAPSSSPEGSSGSSSPSFCSKLAGESLVRVPPRHAAEDEEDEEVIQASCLSLFKHMKRQHTFPSSSAAGGSHHRPSRLFPSFSCGSTQSQGMRFSSDINTLQSFCSSGDRPVWRCFSYDELLHSTNGFHSDNFVGKGGYAVVYKGRLPDGQLIAVKKLITKGESEQLKEGGFLTELGIIGHVNHPNTTSLIGFCVERGLHLIFPFSSSGSLASVLHGPKVKSLGWSVRHKIAVGAAKGLHYLHKLCPRRIIHRDIKASNILLGTDFEPQISDFGLAKWLPEQWTHHTVTPIEGTFGYLAPEYFMHGIVDEKTDVFAYGVLLLELITGRKPIDAAHGNLIVWARPYLESCNVQELVDPNLAAYDAAQLRRVMLTAVLCVRQSPLWRPCMNQVLKLLTDETVDEEIPTNWSTLICSSGDTGDEYSSSDYRTDLSRHRALALGT